MTQTVELVTNKDSIQLELDEKKAPKTVENFLKYVRSGHYNGTVFHRVIKDFMVQGGGFAPGMKQKNSQIPIQNEANNGLKNEKYSIAMARTSDPHSASAQFFINTKNNDFLNFRAESADGWGYAVFGKVVAGKETVDAIERVKTARKGMHGDVPVDDVVIETARVLGDDAAGATAGSADDAASADE